MTVGISSANLATPWLNVIRGTNATGLAGTFIKLHTADPGASGATAAAVGDATRKTITLAAPSGNAIAASTQPVWTNGGTSETISHISLWDASSAGNFILSGALTASQAWVNANTFTLTSLSISLTPIAA